MSSKVRLHHTSTNAKALIPKVAQELNLPEEIVKDIVDHYYDNVINLIETVDREKIYLAHLGTLCFSKRKMGYEVKKIESIMKNKDTDGLSFRTLITGNAYIKRLDLFKQKLKEFENGEQVDKNMEE